MVWYNTTSFLSVCTVCEVVTCRVHVCACLTQCVQTVGQVD